MLDIFAIVQGHSHGDLVHNTWSVKSAKSSLSAHQYTFGWNRDRYSSDSNCFKSGSIKDLSLLISAWKSEWRCGGVRAKQRKLSKHQLEEQGVQSPKESLRSPEVPKELASRGYGGGFEGREERGV